jgi:hypothetical protein
LFIATGRRISQIGEPRSEKKVAAGGPVKGAFREGKHRLRQVVTATVKRGEDCAVPRIRAVAD